jgi:hypothetical protein
VKKETRKKVPKESIWDSNLRSRRGLLNKNGKIFRVSRNENFMRRSLGN